MIRNRIVAITVFALVLASCAIPPTAPATSTGVKGVETADLNRQVEPCTDFYEFANGAWRAANPIPPSKARWSRRIAAQEANRLQVQQMLEDVSRKRDWPSGSAEQVVGTFYASCMDERSVDAAGVTPLAPLLAEIDGVQDREGVQRIIRRLHELAVSVPFGVTGAPDYHQPSTFLLNVTAGTLGMPDRDFYTKNDPRFVEARERYRAHVAKVLKLGGQSEAQAGQAAVNIVALETRLAGTSLDSATASDQASTDHKMTFAQLRQLAPHFNWDAYFDEAKVPKADLNVSEPNFVRQLDKELNETPVEVWKRYLQFQLLDSAAPWLSAPFADESFDFKDKYLGSATVSKPRAERCAASTEALLGEAVGRKYAERYFPPAARAKAQEIARNLQAALKDDVAAVSWMQSETKKKALEKVAATSVQLGYPDTWKDYSTLTIRPRELWANVAAARTFAVGEARQLIGKPTNRNLWQLPPSSPFAYLDPQLNVLVLPAGFLQPPYFNAEATDAVNYGALGIGLAHDLTHAIDVSGSQIDIMGRPRNWWTDADRNEFETRARCVVDQFEGYFIEPGIHHDGRRVLSESIGDLAGARLSYLALQKSMKSHPVPIVDGFTPEQQFFIAWGQTTGAAMGIEAQRKLVSGDPHPVPKFRVIGPLSNSPEFATAFSCRAGAAMVRPPEKRCAVW
jgi:endothelin-converting enzyme/putative endopeptidase